MSEIGPDLEQEAKPSKWRGLKQVAKATGKAAKVTGRTGLMLLRLAVGPGDEIVSAILPSVNTTQESRAAVTPSQEKLKKPFEQKRRKEGGVPPTPNREQRRAARFDRNPQTVTWPAVFSKTESGSPQRPVQPSRPVVTPLRR